MQYTFDNYKALVMLRRDGSFYTLIIWQSAQMAIMSNWRASPATSEGAPYTISWWGARKWRGGMWWHVFVTPLSSHNSKGHWNCWTGFGCRCFPSWKHWDWWESWQLTWRSQLGPLPTVNGAVSFSRQRGPYEPSWPPGPVWTLLNHSFFRGPRGYVKGQVGIDLFDWPWLVFAPVASTQAQRKPQPGRKAQSSKPLWKASLVTSVTLHDETWLSQSCNIHQQIGGKATSHYQDDFTCSSLRKNWEESNIQSKIYSWRLEETPAFLAKPSMCFTEKKCRLTNKLTERPKKTWWKSMKAWVSGTVVKKKRYY